MTNTPKDKQEIHYSDKVVVLNNGSTLLARILVDQEYKMNDAIAVYRPMEVIDTFTSGIHGITGDFVGTIDTQTLTNKTLTSPTIENIFIRKWILATNDDVLVIPLNKILNISKPNSLFEKAYSNAIGPNYGNYQVLAKDLGYSETTRAIITSTPNGMNLFYKLWMDAKMNRSENKNIETEKNVENYKKEEIVYH